MQMKKSIVDEIINVVCETWKNNINKDYLEGLLLEEHIEMRFYHHLRTKLGKLLNENNLCIYTEYLGSEFKELGYRPDMVVVKMKKDCDEKYLINHIEEVVVAFEFKFKDKYEFNTIVADADKIYNYIKRINNNCQYVMAIIHEKILGKILFGLLKNKLIIGQKEE